MPPLLANGRYDVEGVVQLSYNKQDASHVTVTANYESKSMKCFIKLSFLQPTHKRVVGIF
jgi:hypothetical protein